MTPKRALIALACATALAVAGCGGSGGNDQGSASGAAQAYVDASNHQDFNRICAVLSDSYKQQLHITSNCPGFLKELASGGGRPSLKLLGVHESGDKATADLELTGESGAPVPVQATLERQNGVWRIADLGAGAAP
jgi:hypothetical protein